MNADDLDGHIRSLVHDAIAAAPPAPDLPTSVPVTSPPNRGRGWVWAGIGIAAAVVAATVLVMTNRDDTPSIVAASTSDVSTTADPNALPWPDGVSALVASERGIEKITSENGRAVVTRLLADTPVSRAFELEDGSIVYQETGGDIRRLTSRLMLEPPLVPKTTAQLELEDADSTATGWRIVYRTEGTKPEDALTLTAHFVPNDPVSYPQPGGFGVGYRRFTIVDDHAVTTATMDDTGQRSGYMVRVNPIGVLATYGLEAASPTPLQQVGDGSGSIGVLDEKGQFTSYGRVSGFTANLGDPTAVTDLDFRGQWLAVQRDGGTSSLVDLVGGTAYELRKDRVDTQPVPTTVQSPSTSPSTSLEPTPTTVLPIGLPAMIATGPNGVWEYGSAEPVQWSTEPMAFAVKAPDGSVIVQRRAGNGEGGGWTVADTLPLRIASPGAPPTDLFGELFPAADVVAAWWTVHDAATVDGRPLLLLDRQAPQSSGIDTPAGTVVVVDLAARSIDDVGSAGGWEEGISRLHLSETGLIVGERYSGVSRSLFALSLNGGAVPTAESLGVQPSYDDCGDCPRLYTVSRDGRTIAWLDGTNLVQRGLDAAAAFPLIDLGELAGAARDLSISGDQVLFDRNAATSVRVTVDGDRAHTEVLADATRTAAI